MGVSPDMYGVPSAAVMSVISASLLVLPRPRCVFMKPTGALPDSLRLCRLEAPCPDAEPPEPPEFGRVC